MGVQNSPCRTPPEGASQAESALALLHASHALVKPRVTAFSAHSSPGIRERVLNSGDFALIEGTGVCGSYTHVLALALKSAGFPVRIAQMRCGDRWSCHILLETRIDGRWVVMDPSFDLAFRNRDGTLASFSQVRRDWARHRDNLPAEYPLEYAYEDVRYTNWDKVPGLMPLIKWLLDIVLGEAANEISLRAHVLHLYRTYLWACIPVTILVLFMTARTLTKFRIT
jgi:hypothetical protein